MLRRTGFITVLLAVLALLALQVAPALAHHKDGHDGGKGSTTNSRDNDGDADSDSSTAYTEDNDTNDGNTPNNVEDGGDNAHPSGKDRSVENGGSGNQGNSESDPDDDGRGPDRSNGGPDKPNGSGGTDLADQDGNNGCGNDDDFEDDNEGWCGKPKDDDEVESDTEVKGFVCPEGTDMAGRAPSIFGCDIPENKVCPLGSDMAGLPPAEHGCNDDDVLGSVTTDDDVKVKKDSVLGTRFTSGAPAVGAGTAAAAAPGGVLPFTGVGVIPFAVFGLALIGAGSALIARKR